MLIDKLRKWRKERRRFPVLWLTYKQRVRHDVERAFKEDGGPSFFDEKYVGALTDAARKLESWELKLLLYQAAISAFVVLGLVTTDAAISLFGVSLKHATGLKEILVAVSATLAVVLYAVSQSKQLRLTVIERLTELRSDEKFVTFAKLATPSSFNIHVYIARQFDKWVFPTFINRLTMTVLSLLFAILLITMIALSLILWVYLNVQILRELSLGIWSYAALVYSWLAYTLCVLWLIRAHSPLPFKDMHVVHELSVLEKSDPAAYKKRLEEVYGS